MKYLCLLIALLFEIIATFGLLLTPSAQPLVDYLLYHGLASAGFAFGFQSLISVYYQQARWVLLLCLFGLIFFIPMGWVIVMAVFIALIIPKEQQDDFIEVTNRKSLPFEPFKFSDAPHQGLGGLGEIIRHAADPEKRQMAVMALNNVTERDAIPLLKIALRDIDDDVRLLAYARLDQLENEITHQINQYQVLLDSEDLQTQTTYHRLIAEQLWELSYLGLSEGETQRYHLEQALVHAQSSLKNKESTGLRLMLGRIYLALGQYQLAHQAFIAAQAAGEPAKRVLPYLAEVAFLQKRYSQVTSSLAQLGKTEQSALNQLKEYWL
ncbi:hypothetical protein A9Q98_13115 [Thalassotalea sp. 42_200_T64]|nr:hypothetical protein A9Q98_13115 [Thalassotalea sp. 42_200_T64]